MIPSYYSIKILALHTLLCALGSKGLIKTENCTCHIQLVNRLNYSEYLNHASQDSEDKVLTIAINLRFKRQFTELNVVLFVNKRGNILTQTRHLLKFN